MNPQTGGGDRAKPQTRAELLAPQVAELQQQGYSRNRIAEQLKTSQGTVTRAAQIAGVSFTQTQQLEKATQIAALDAKELRTKLELSLLRAGLLAADKLPYADPREARDLVVVAGVAMDKSHASERLKLVAGYTKTDMSAVTQWMDYMQGRTVIAVEPEKGIGPDGKYLPDHRYSEDDKDRIYREIQASQAEARARTT